MSSGEQDMNGNLLWLFLIAYLPEDGNITNFHSGFNKLE
jgi:hypothetical protein